MASQKILKQQLRELMNLPANSVCLDCNDKRPTWASLVVPPPGSSIEKPIGCFCCYHCSGAHRRMGTHICFVRSTNLDEWKEKEVIAMRVGGNKLVNAIFEANLIDKSVKPDKHTELEERSEFIYKKYQHRQWYDPAACEVDLLAEKDHFANGPSGSDIVDWGSFSFSALPLDAINADSPTKTPQPPMALFSPFGSSKGGDRRDLISTLERMESTANVLDDIAHLDVGPDPSSPEPKPRRLTTKKKKKTTLSSRSTSEPRKQSDASDRKKKKDEKKQST